MTKKKIRGIEGMTPEQLNFELQRGARFVIFQYAISIIVMSFRRSVKPMLFEVVSSPARMKYRLVGNSVRTDLHGPGPGHKLPRRQGRYERSCLIPCETCARSGGMNRGR